MRRNSEKISTGSCFLRKKDEYDRQRAADEAREWKQVAEYCYADNSVEVVMQDRDGNEKTVMTVYPHGD